MSYERSATLTQPLSPTLVRQLPFGTGVASLSRGPEAGGAHAGLLAEDFREVALVKETGAEGDLRDRCVGLLQVPAGVLDAEPAQVLADRAVAVLAEGAGKVGGMDSGFLCQARQRERFARAVVELLEHSYRWWRDGVAGLDEEGLLRPLGPKGAFFAGESTFVPARFYVMAIVVITINLWMLARAAWDL